MSGEESKKDVVEVSGQALPDPGEIRSLVSADTDIIDDRYISKTAKQIELRSKFLTIALKALRPHDIQNFEGKPYIEGEGAARIMAVVRGFKVHEARFQIETVDKHIFVECELPVEFMGATTVALGDCSTAESFFTGSSGDGGRYAAHLKRTGSEALAARLLLGDAKKKARENAMSRAVTELLGLKGLSWDELKAMGFDISGAGSQVSFKKGAQGGPAVTMSVAQAIEVAVGSVINVRGFCVDVKTKEVGNDKKKISRYNIIDGKNSIWVQKWGEAKSFNPDKTVFCSNTAVAEYQGEKQYTAESIEYVESEGEPNGK